MKCRSRIIIVASIVGLLLVAFPYGSQAQSREARTQHKERQAEINKMRSKLRPLMQYSMYELQLALTIKVIDTYGGAKIYADDDDNTYLGTIDNEFASDSIFNDFGVYGNEFGAKSIWNDFGSFGGEFSAHSPFNKFSSSSPLIVKNKKIIGRLSVNQFEAGAVDPRWLMTHFK